MNDTDKLCAMCGGPKVPVIDADRETMPRLLNMVDHAIAVLWCIEKGRYQNGDHMDREGMRSCASSLVEELQKNPR